MSWSRPSFATSHHTIADGDSCPCVLPDVAYRPVKGSVSGQDRRRGTDRRLTRQAAKTADSLFASGSLCGSAGPAIVGPFSSQAAYPPVVYPEPRVLAGRVLAQQVRHLTVLLTAAAGLVDEPVVGTPARGDIDHINGHARRSDLLGLRWWAHGAVRLNLRSADEHQRGLKLVLTGDELLPLPAMALARSIYEAVIGTCWLIDADVVTDQRLARWAGRLLHDTQEPPNALDSFGNVDAARHEKERVTGGHVLGRRLMTRAGFDLKLKGEPRTDQTSQVTYRGEVSGLTPRVTELVPRFTPNQQFLWPLFSGATHSRGWLVASLEGDAALMTAAVLTPLLDASDALAIEVARYFGLNARPMLDRTHLHRRALLRSARPQEALVASVDQYRAAGGAPPLP